MEAERTGREGRGKRRGGGEKGRNWEGKERGRRRGLFQSKFLATPLVWKLKSVELVQCGRVRKMP